MDDQDIIKFPFSGQELEDNHRELFSNFLLFHIKKMSEKGCTAFVDNFLLQNEILSKSKGFAPDPIPDQTNQDASTENMFDAIIVPSLKGASSFIQQILALQPLIVDPGKSFLDGVIGNFLCNDESFGEKPALPPGVDPSQDWKQLLLSNLSLIDKKFKYVLVQHSYISGFSAPKSVAEHLSKIVKKDGFLQIVRPPFSALRSNFNHELMTHFLGNHSFKQLISNSIFDDEKVYTLDDIAGLENLKDPKKKLKLPFSGMTVRSLTKRFMKKKYYLSGQLHYSVGKNYSEFLGKWNTVDFSDRRGSKEIIDEILTFLGLKFEPVVPNLLLEIPFMDQLRRCMATNWFHLKVNDKMIRIGVDLALRASITTIFPQLEIAWFVNGKQSYDSASNKTPPLCLYIDREMFKLFDGDDRKILLDQNFLQKIGKIIVDRFFLEFGLWRRVADRFLITKDSASFKSEMIDFYKDDITNFLNTHPRFESIWSEEKKLL